MPSRTEGLSPRKTNPFKRDENSYIGHGGNNGASRKLSSVLLLHPAPGNAPRRIATHVHVDQASAESVATLRNGVRGLSGTWTSSRPSPLDRQTSPKRQGPCSSLKEPRMATQYGQSRTEGTCATAASSHLQLSATSNTESSYSIRASVFFSRPYPLFPVLLFFSISPLCFSIFSRLTRAVSWPA